ncbi:DUF1302 domain-containing protein [Halopseudomonas salegens]|uniref:DUF1302 domain-containing protein n=1 Tax=Halopseudomonas salegens TaxID=1434072 RepID=A0A1H2E5C8_9GAMM|nr:DUF1302 domain-containing protein [Halopseudomonas salegens]SDT90235.1 Protein of unknown function [Halopseudomonas salegens]
MKTTKNQPTPSRFLTKNNPAYAFGALSQAKPRLLLLSFFGAASLMVTPTASVEAVELDVAGWEGSVDTVLTYGTVYRMQEPSGKSIASSNGGDVDNGPLASDDANLNFRKGDLVSEVAKVVSELQLQKDNYGLFVRGRAFYDFELMDDDRRHREISDDGLDLAGSGVELLDAFVQGSWDLGERPLSVRVGRQVVNWGEALYAQNGIAATNPYDLSALRAPGSQLREAFIPTEMLFGSFGLTDNLNLSGYWQPGSAWEPVRLDPCGSFFSTNDIVGDSQCDYLPVASLQELITGAVLGSPTAFDSPDELRAYLDGVPGPLQGLAGPLLASTFIPRAEDVEPDGSQYGLSLRWFAPELNQTEFGLYYLRYHSQAPVVSASAANVIPTPLGFFPDASSATYFAEYVGRRDLYGFSFNTSITGGPLEGVAVAGELSYRPDSVVSLYTPGAVIAPAVNGSQPAGTYIPGYIERDRIQASTSLLYISSRRLLGADSTTLIGEVAANRVMGSLPSELLDDPLLPGGFTNSSWGTTLSAAFTYENVLDVFRVTPSVSAYAAINGRNGANNEGQRAYSLQVNALYKDSIGGGVSYTAYHGGGRSDRDRDFLSLFASYSF